jgi:para-nitrobenzyl esterase
VPYADAPEGPRRFQPPQPSPPWDGPRTAIEFGPSSISTDVPGLVLPSGSGVVPESEDCLYLNVWSPRARGKPRPVLVWLHGGAFVFGSGSNFDGAWLANRGDAVVVTINYRLGPWGFLDLAAIGGTGLDQSVNVGMLDQVAALQWVSDNIEAFGGDPDRVTVIGQASGATCVGALLAMPAAAGLFHRAVMQSGAADRVQSRWRSRSVVVRVLNSLGVDYREVSKLQDLPVEAIKQAAGSLMRDSDDAELEGEPFLPVVDGTVLPGHPMAGLVSGASSQVPLLISTCQQEANLYLAISPEGFIKAKELRARAWFGDVAWERLVRTYEKGSPPDRGRADLLTDLLFGIPAVRTAEAHHRGGGRTWIMRFDHTPGQVPFDQLGPCHGADLPFTWLDFTGPTEGAFPGLSTNADRTVAELLQDVILNFARLGDPGIPALPAWPSYQPGRRAVMSIQSRAALDMDPAPERRRAWDALPLPQTLNVRRSSSPARPPGPRATVPASPAAKSAPEEPQAPTEAAEPMSPAAPAPIDTWADPAPAETPAPAAVDSWADPSPLETPAPAEPAEPANPEAPTSAESPPDATTPAPPDPETWAAPPDPAPPTSADEWVDAVAPAPSEPPGTAEPERLTALDLFDGWTDADLPTLATPTIFDEPASPTSAHTGAEPAAPIKPPEPERLGGPDWFDGWADEYPPTSLAATIAADPAVPADSAEPTTPAEPEYPAPPESADDSSDPVAPEGPVPTMDPPSRKVRRLRRSRQR